MAQEVRGDNVIEILAGEGNREGVGMDTKVIEITSLKKRFEHNV